MEDLTRLGRDAVPALLGTLTAPRSDQETTRGQVDVGVANDVAVVLGSIGDPRAVRPLMDAGKEFIVSGPRALGKFPEGVDALVAGLDDPDEHVRACCLGGLAFAQTDERRVIVALKRGIRDPSASVRRSAANTAIITEVSDPELLNDLEQAMRRDEDGVVRRMAEKAHARLGMRLS